MNQTEETNEEINKETNEETNEEINKETKKNIQNLGIGIILFSFLWILFGIIAFIKSIMCFSSESSLIEKIIGLVLALMFGPIYFIYLYFNKNYCKKNQSNHNLYKKSNNNNLYKKSNNNNLYKKSNNNNLYKKSNNNNLYKKSNNNNLYKKSNNNK